MANADLPRGFRLHGEPLRVGIYIAAGTIYPGDMVKFHAGTSSTTKFRAQVEVAAATNPLCGMAMNYATVGQKVRVADSPDQLFAGQASASEIDNQLDLGLNASILAAAGSATYKVSRQEIDSATIATTATLELKILGAIERQDGKNELGANVECIVKINNHQLGSSTGTLGV